MTTIAFVTATISRKAGGLFSSVRSLAKALAKTAMFDVHVLSSADEFSEQDLAAWRPLVPQAFPRIGPSAFGYAPALDRALCDIGPEAVRVDGLWAHPSVACLRRFRRTKMPYVVAPRGMLDPWALRQSASKKRIAGWLFENAHLQNAACIHALCEAEARAIRSYGLTNPVVVIPNGIDLPDGKQRRSEIEGRTLVSGPAASKMLLFLGRIHPKKGLAELIDGWRISRARRNGWVLEIAGWDDGGHEAGLRDRTARLGLEDSVRWAGPLFAEAKDHALRRASAFILPSFSEGLPMAVLEAWAYGLPVLITPQCNLAGGIAAGAAIQIELNAASIAEGLDRLAAHSDADLDEMGRRGYALVEEKFTWPEVAAQMKAVYDWVLDRGPQPQCAAL
jgi:glycosyltransferase involved in cell wall biosynthesis